MVGLNDLKGSFQPKQFHDPSWTKKKGQTISFNSGIVLSPLYSNSTGFELKGLTLNDGKHIPLQLHTVEVFKLILLILCIVFYLLQFNRHHRHTLLWYVFRGHFKILPVPAQVQHISLSSPKWQECARSAFLAPGSRLSLVRPGLSPPKHRWCCPAFPCCCRCAAAAAAHSLLNNYLKWLCHVNRKEEYSNWFCIRKEINTFLLFRRFFSHLEACEWVLISTDTPA